jgi:hypothetical protein
MLPISLDCPFLIAPSLFSSKRIIECHLTTGKIGQKGSKALSEIAANVADDILFIVSNLHSNAVIFLTILWQVFREAEKNYA